MKDLPKELIDFQSWCKKNTTRNLSEGIDLAMENYAKSINSEAGNETPTVTDNEAKKESCPRCGNEKVKQVTYNAVCWNCGKKWTR